MPGRELAQRARHGGRLPGDPLQRPPRIAARTDGDRPGRAPAQGTREAADVVGVQVGEHDQGERADAEPRQAPVDQVVLRAGVDEHRAAFLGRGQHDRVPLADVARHDRPAGRRPARPQHPRRDQDEQQPDEQGEHGGTQPGRAAEGGQHDEHRREQEGTD